MLRRLSCLPFLVLAACAPGPDRTAAPPTRADASAEPAWRGLSAPARLLRVSERVGPVGEAMCRDAARHPEVGASAGARNCAFVIALDPDRNLPANAMQGVLPDGRPIVAFTFAIVERAANEHELALVLGHEMAHHIADHGARETRRIAEARAAADHAVIPDEGGPAAPPGERLSPGTAAGRAFLRGIELEADQFGARIAAAAGYDAALGLKIIGRFDGKPGSRYPRDHYPTTRQREAAVLSALAR